MAKDTLYDWCIEQRAIMQDALEGYQDGSWKIGEVIDGKMTDQTAEEIADLTSRIADLDNVIAGYAKRALD